MVHTLETHGVLGQIRAQLRAHVYKAVENDEANGSGSAGKSEGSPSRLMKSPVGRLMAEVVAEFFDFYGFRHSLSVLVPEAGLGAERRSRADIAFDVGLPVLSDASILEQLVNLATGTDLSKPEDWPSSAGCSTTASTPPPSSLPSSQSQPSGSALHPSRAGERQRAGNGGAASDDAVASARGGVADSRRDSELESDLDRDLDADWKVLGKRLEYEDVPEEVRADMMRLQQMKQRSAGFKSSAADAVDKTPGSPTTSPAPSPSAAVRTPPQSSPSSPPESPSAIVARGDAQDDEESKSFSDSDGSGSLDFAAAKAARLATGRAALPPRSNVSRLSSTNQRPAKNDLGEVEEDSVFEEGEESSADDDDDVAGFPSDNNHSDNDSF